MLMGEVTFKTRDRRESAAGLGGQRRT
jgi:hypothetical protein